MAAETPRFAWTVAPASAITTRMNASIALIGIICG